MEMHFATVWESIADAIPDAPAITHGDTTRTWAQYDDRAARLAGAIDRRRARPRLQGRRSTCTTATSTSRPQYAAFKLRGVPINVNYRYLDEELWYLLDNSDAEALVFHSSLGDRVANVVDRLPKLKLLIEVDDGADGRRCPDAVRVRGRPRRQRRRCHASSAREDDIYMLYTGGTTGMPKGVMYSMAS